MLAARADRYRLDTNAQAERPRMTPRVDPKIPPLVSATRAAELLDSSKNWVSKLMDRGDLHGVTVGANTVLAEQQVKALAQRREQGQEGWTAPPPPAIPALVSTGGAAELLGFAQENYPRQLFRQGKLPGVQVGRNVMFRLDVVTRFATLRQLGHTSYPAEAEELQNPATEA